MKINIEKITQGFLYCSKSPSLTFWSHHVYHAVRSTPTPAAPWTGGFRELCRVGGWDPESGCRDRGRGKEKGLGAGMCQRDGNERHPTAQEAWEE